MTTSHTLTDTRAIRPVDYRDGVFFIGRPDWLTNDLFSALRQEARQQRPDAAKIRAQHFGELGPVAQQLCESAVLAEFVSSHAAPARFSGKANYRYYDIPHSQVRPHLDNDDFTFNAILMLSHESGAERRSALLLFPHGPQDPTTVCLTPGEVILFHANCLIHARTPISEDGDEWAENIGMGFTPISEAGFADPGFWHPAEGWSSE